MLGEVTKATLRAREVGELNEGGEEREGSKAVHRRGLRADEAEVLSGRGGGSVGRRGEVGVLGGVEELRDLAAVDVGVTVDDNDPSSATRSELLTRRHHRVRGATLEPLYGIRGPLREGVEDLAASVADDDDDILDASRFGGVEASDNSGDAVDLSERPRATRERTDATPSGEDDGDDILAREALEVEGGRLRNARRGVEVQGPWTKNRDG